MEHYLPKIKKQPTIEKVPCSLSPEEVYSHFSEQKNTAFLNSSLETDVGRFSFIGIDPFLVLKGKGHNLTLNLNDHIIPIKKDPFDALSSVLETYKLSNPSGLPFSSGGIGYFSYDLKNVLEKLPQTASDDLMLPDIYFTFYRSLIIIDKKDTGHAYISILEIDGYPEDSSSLLSKLKPLLQKTPDTQYPTPDTRHPIPDTPIPSNFTKEEYIKAINKTIDYIKAGDIYQACISQRFSTEWHDTPYELYLKLNSINPSPFSAYLDMGDAQIVSSSPELYLHFSENSLETRPMKGTRPRGANKDEDESLTRDLKDSSKDNAELSMIVDLERNDLGKICSPGSVKVKEHRRIEEYPTVYQTISVVEGSIESGTKLTDIVKATFPGGSITGCPKIRAMEIIDELEPTARSVYTGSIGYMSFHGTMNLNVAIRTMIMQKNKVYFQAGGGITAESDPEKEYEETLHKAKAMMESLGFNGK